SSTAHRARRKKIDRRIGQLAAATANPLAPRKITFASVSAVVERQELQEVAMPACKLARVHNTPPCTFKAKTGTVTLQVDGTTGSVQFLSATYNGAPIAGLPSNQITFTIVGGTTNLDVVYGFSDPQHGTGTLSELCNTSKPLIDVDALENPVQYRICGRGSR